MSKETSTDFSFQTCKELVNKSGALKELGIYCRKLGIQKPLIVTDGGIVKAGLLDQALKPLNEMNLEVFSFTEVVADPPVSVVEAATEFAKSNDVDGIVGLGGGSPMDTAKLVALLARSDEKLADIYGVDNVKGKRLPLIQIPTTAGTGSEVTPVAIVTTGESTKMGVVSSCLLPDIALLDSELTIGLPPSVTASTGIDAMVHAIEAYTSKSKKNIYSDILSKNALKLLADNLPLVIEDPKNLSARQNMLLGAMMAGQSFANAPVAAVHALAYPLGGQFHINHGLSNSLVLPEVLKFNADFAAKEYAELAPWIMGDSFKKGSDTQVTQDLVAFIQDLIKKVGLPTKLSQLEIPKNALPILAEDAMKQTRLLINNPRQLEYKDALNIYEASY